MEQHGYFTVPGAHLYTVLHQAPAPLAKVLLVGPFASERQFSYNVWVRWARYLSERRIEVLRFDYRGVGESTGSFEEMTFRQWNEDLALLIRWLETRTPNVPLILHGLEVGALFASKHFFLGAAKALLLWAPPGNANLALRATLRRWAGMEQLFDSLENRKSALQYIRDLEHGSVVEVHGYEWSSRLWQESLGFTMPSELQNISYDDARDRPVKVVTFGKHADSLVMPYRRYEEGQNLAMIYSSSFEWITETLNTSYLSLH